MAKYEHIELSKDMYSTSKSLTEYLETISDTNDIETQGLDAYEKQLKRFDIKVSGGKCDTVAKFFSNERTAILFPEFIKRIIQTGYEKNIAVFDSCVLANTVYYNESSSKNAAQINSTSYQYPNSSRRKIQRISGVENIILRYLDCNYDTIKNLKISSFATILKGIGYDLGKDDIRLFISNIMKESDNIPKLHTRICDSNHFNTMGMSLFSDNDIDTVLCTSRNLNKLIDSGFINPNSCENIDHGIIKTIYGITFIACDFGGVNTDTYYSFDSNMAFEKHIYGNIKVKASHKDNDNIDSISTIIDRSFIDLGGKISVNYTMLDSDRVFVLKVKD